MKKLDVSIELGGRQREVGSIIGDSEFNAEFIYSEDYLKSEMASPISISLPLSSVPFEPERTRNFFEGLLPEGFLRRTVAKNNRTDANDYLSLLELLGAECLGAISIRSDSYRYEKPAYRKLSTEHLYRLAAEGATRSADLVVEAHLSLTGASGKIGVYKDSAGEWFLPVGSAPSTHILKQSHIRFDHIVQNEQLCLLTAEKLGISTPKSIIIDAKSSGKSSEVIFATERFDRTMDGSISSASGMPCPLRLHQEDFAQAMGIPASNKYEQKDGHFMRDMFDILRRYSSSPIEDQIQLWDIIVFHYLIGNTDGHIKNYSLLYDSRLRSVRLAPAYDIVSTIVYETHSKEMAFSIGGEKDWYKLDRACFERAADECRLSRKLFMQRFDTMESRFSKALDAAVKQMTNDGYGAAEEIAESIFKIRKTVE